MLLRVVRVEYWKPRAKSRISARLMAIGELLAHGAVSVQPGQRVLCGAHLVVAPSLANLNICTFTYALYRRVRQTWTPREFAFAHSISSCASRTSHNGETKCARYVCCALYYTRHARRDAIGSDIGCRRCGFGFYMHIYTQFVGSSRRVRSDCKYECAVSDGISLFFVWLYIKWAANNILNPRVPVGR